MKPTKIWFNLPVAIVIILIVILFDEAVGACDNFFPEVTLLFDTFHFYGLPIEYGIWLIRKCRSSVLSSLDIVIDEIVRLLLFVGENWHLIISKCILSSVVFFLELR